MARRQAIDKIMEPLPSAWSTCEATEIEQGGCIKYGHRSPESRLLESDIKLLSRQQNRFLDRVAPRTKRQAYREALNQLSRASSTSR